MKIALFTPVHEHSAIARVSGLLTEALVAQGDEVVVVSTDDLELSPQETRDELLGSVHWRQQTAIRDLVWEADLVVHQVGNHWGHHAGSVFWLPLVGGVAVLHDFFIGDLFLEWAEHHDAEADGLLRRLYGIGITDFRTIAHSGRFAQLAWPAYPLTEWLAESADAVVAHSDFGLPGVRRATDAQTLVLPLIGSLEPLPAATTTVAGRVRLLTFGHIIPNKLCEDTIAALSADRAVREGSLYRICGPISDDYRAALQSFADSLGVAVEITGSLSRDDLLAELSAADLIACVRRPTLESGSASAIESMLSGTPVVVIDEGFYSSLPHDVVLLVGPENVQADLQRVLRHAIDGGLDLGELGARAKTYAEATFRADGYARALTALAPVAAEHRLLREVDSTYASLRHGTRAVAARYARDTAILRPDQA